MACVAIATAVLSCSKFDENLNQSSGIQNTLPTNSLITENSAYRDGELILGKQLQNPYTLANMSRAVADLNKEGLSTLKPENIRATHYYVKFMPADSVQMERLDADKNLTLYPHPLDYEIIQRGNEYQDPTTPRGAYAYQYASVRVGQALPKVHHVILSHLYIPEEDPNLIGVEHEAYLDRLLDRAYILTENYQDTIKADKGKSQKPEYHPGGKIQIFDTRLNALIGLQGVDMRARRWFTTHHATTDFWGNYRMAGDFRRPCNYSLWFSHMDFIVKKHLIALTYWLNGPKQTADWNVDITSGYDRFAGHIFRGAYRYHYGFIDGLKRPYHFQSGRIWYIGVDDMNSAGINYAFVPVIRISRHSINAEYQSDEIFSTTIHETAHISHLRNMSLGALEFLFINGVLRESWAVGVEWWLTKLEYKNTRGIFNYGDADYSISVQYPHYYSYQYWNKNLFDKADKYTSLFVNLVDGVNEYNQSYGFGGTGTVFDEVKNYKLNEIEGIALGNSYNLDHLTKELKLFKPNGVTNQQIDLLMSHY